MEHCNNMLKEHKGDDECELVKVLQENNVDISAYHGDSIVGNHCMSMAMTKTVKPKIRHVYNKIYLESTSVLLKQILSLCIS